MNRTFLTFRSFGRWSSIQVYPPIPYVRRTASGRCTGRTSIAFHLRRVQRATCLSALDAVNIVVVHLGLGQYVYLGHSSFWFCHLLSPRPSEIERRTYHRLIAAISREIRKGGPRNLHSYHFHRTRKWRIWFVSPEINSETVKLPTIFGAATFARDSDERSSVPRSSVPWHFTKSRPVDKTQLRARLELTEKEYENFVRCSACVSYYRVRRL